MLGSPDLQGVVAVKVKATEVAALITPLVVHVIFPDATTGDRRLSTQLVGLAAVLVTEQEAAKLAVFVVKVCVAK
jgi:hypothetical protein